jgi:tetratricopeptide (TPR) repeat protein
MQFPAGSIIFFIIWVAVTLILWNLYHYSHALRKKTFITLLLVAFFGLMGGIVFLYLQQQPAKPTDRTGLLIFPFIEQTAPGRGNTFTKNMERQITPQGLAIADMIAEHLRLTPDAPFYIIPTRAIFEIADLDSLADLDYILKFSRHAQLQAVAFGKYTITSNQQHQENWQVDFRFVDFQNVEAGSRSIIPTFTVENNFKSISEVAAELAEAILKESSTNNSLPATSIWQNDMPADLMRRYYAVHLALARNETEQALKNAWALFRADSSAPHFVGLYAYTLMTHLRRQRTSKMVWEDSLRLVLPYLKRVALRGSLHIEYQRLLGEAYIYLEKWNEAERVLVQAYRRDPADSKIFVNLAQLHSSRLHALGFNDELDLYQQALALNPIDVEAGIAAADYLLLQNRENEAITLLEKFFYLNPNHLGVLMSLGRLYIVKGQAMKIFEIYERVLTVDPDNADAYYNLGIAYYNREDFENAIRFFERAITLNNHVNARMYLSYIYERQGEIDKALYYLRERIRLSQGEDDKVADEARRHLYELLLARGEIPSHLQPDSLKTP